MSRIHTQLVCFASMVITWCTRVSERRVPSDIYNFREQILFVVSIPHTITLFLP